MISSFPFIYCKMGAITTSYNVFETDPSSCVSCVSVFSSGPLQRDNSWRPSSAGSSMERSSHMTGLKTPICLYILCVKDVKLSLNFSLANWHCCPFSSTQKFTDPETSQRNTVGDKLWLQMLDICSLCSSENDRVEFTP